MPLLKQLVLEKVCADIVSNAKEKGIYIDRINGYDEHLHVF